MGSKPGRAPTSGTRKGNGAGRGGPARTPAPEFAADSPTRENAADWNHDKETQSFRAEQHRKSIARRRALWKATDALISDPSHPAHWQAIKDTKDRLEGPVKQHVDLHTTTVATARDEDLLAIALAGGGNSASTPGNTDEPA